MVIEKNLIIEKKSVFEFITVPCHFYAAGPSFCSKEEKIRSLMEDFVNHHHNIRNFPLKYYHKWADLGILW